MSLALNLAVVRGDVEELRRGLIDNPQEIDSLYKGQTPLYQACYRGYTEMVTLLLDYGANINHQEPTSGTTPLYASCSKGYHAIVELLLERGANPAICSTRNRTPLMDASYRGHTNVVRCLLNHP